MKNPTNLISRCQVAAILFMFAGWGWNGGNFTPADAPLVNPLAHFIPIVLLLALSLPILRMRSGNPQPESNASWATIGITIFVVLAIISDTVMIILGATNPNPNSVGVHTLEDWFPVIITNIGTLLWLATLIPARLGRAAARTAGNV